jgi:ElaB/YqjD/DUF883 family membrane-anchored ribosome-binding protein
MESKVMKKTAVAGERLAELGTGIAAEAAQIKERVKDTFEESLETARDKAKRAIKSGRIAAEDLLDDAAYRVKKNPLPSVGATFGVGLAFGMIIGWLAARPRK